MKTERGKTIFDSWGGGVYFNFLLNPHRINDVLFVFLTESSILTYCPSRLSLNVQNYINLKNESVDACK